MITGVCTEDENGACIYSETYDVDGNLTEIFDNDETTTYTYTTNSLKDITSVTTRVNGEIFDCTEYTYIEIDSDNDGIIDKTEFVSSKKTDEDGTVHFYDSEDRLIRDEKPLGTVISQYSYDADGNLTSKTENGKTISYTYSGENLTQVSRNNTTYGYTYNAFGDITKFKVGNQTIASYSYKGNNGPLSQITYGNGDTEKYSYNAYGQVSKITETGLGSYSFNYDSKGKLIYKTDSINKQKTYYEYDSTGQLIGNHVNSTIQSNVYANDLYDLRLKYDEGGNLSQNTVNINGSKISTSFSYSNDDLLENVQLTSIRAISYEYDDDQRITSRSLSTDTPVTEEFTYNEDESIATHKIGNDTYAYTYNDEGNIIEIKKNGVLRQSYVYDNENQLIRENNLDTNKTIVYTYDDGGNISKKKEYVYTLGEVGSDNNTINYTYSSGSWKDLLTNFNGQTISYDQIGNPTSYRGATTTWFGRQLQSYTTGDNLSVSYSYDSNGLRTKKIVNGVEYDYYYVDDQLIYEKKGNEYELFYRYDTDGRLCLVVKNRISDNHKLYYYVITNTQGDVIEIHNGAGAIVAKYNYDSWGKLISVTNANGNSLSNSSFAYQISIRYRGYVYDNETGLYYLQSRYYDPETGRFINCDNPDYIGANDTFAGWNGFAYCENDPVNDTDPGGDLSQKIIQGILGGCLGLLVQYLADLISVKFLKGSWSDVVIYVKSVVKGAWDAVTSSGLLKQIIISVGANILEQIYNKIRYKINFSGMSVFLNIIDTCINYVIDKYLKIKSPQFIRDIKSKARDIGIKGTRKLTEYLNKQIFKVSLENITISNIKNLFEEFSKKALSFLFPSTKAKQIY